MCPYQYQTKARSAVDHSGATCLLPMEATLWSRVSPHSQNSSEAASAIVPANLPQQMLGSNYAQAEQDVQQAKSSTLPPLQSVVELTSAAAPPSREAVGTATAVSSAGASGAARSAVISLQALHSLLQHLLEVDI